MSGNIDKVLETLADPERVIAGQHGESLALRTYASTNITRKTAVVVYRDEEDGFLITAFFTSKPDKIKIGVTQLSSGDRWDEPNNAEPQHE
jgi:hypothetical protein